MNSSTGNDGDYEIPDFLTPLKTWQNGYSVEDTMRFRTEYSYADLVETGDVGAFALVNLGDIQKATSCRRKGPVRELGYNLMPEIGSVLATTRLGPKTLKEAIDDPRSRIRAFAVIHKGKIVYEEYPAMREWDSHFWSSGTKSITGLLIAILEEEGQVDLTKTVGHYLPDFRRTVWGNIPLGDVVHQRSGLDIEENNFDKPGHPIGAFYRVGFDGGDGTGRSLREVMKTVKVIQPPGMQFIYSSINTQMAAQVVEAVTSKPWHEVLMEKVWHKLGAEGDVQVGLSSRDEPNSFGMLSSRLRDFARYGMLYTPSWNVVATERVVPQRYFKRMYDASKPKVYRGGYMAERIVNDFGETNVGTSYQWDAIFADGDMYKSGRCGQFLYISPGTDTVVVAFSATYRSEIWLHHYTREIVTSLLRK